MDQASYSHFSDQVLLLCSGDDHSPQPQLKDHWSLSCLFCIKSRKVVQIRVWIDIGFDKQYWDQYHVTDYPNLLVICTSDTSSVLILELTWSVSKRENWKRVSVIFLFLRISREVKHYYNLLLCRHVCRYQKRLTFLLLRGNFWLSFRVNSVFLNIRANVKDASKYVGSDSYVI